MFPVLTQFFGYDIPSFGVMMALAFVAGLGWTYLRAQKAGENATLYLEGFPWIIIAAIFGARICYLAFFPDEFLADPVGSFFSPGGLVWYGGMIGVILAILIFTRSNKIPFWKFADIIAPPTALGLAIGRIGCFLAGCCYGGPCDLPWAIHYPAYHPTFPHAVHPAPLYESIAVLILAWVLTASEKRNTFTGQTGCGFLIGYGLIRFALEYARGDRLVWLPGLELSASQVISLAGVLIGILLYQWLKKPNAFKRTGVL